MLVEAIALFLALSLVLYCVLGGADFGGGMLECFRGKKLRKEQKALINSAIAPVWEANHVWLILAIVIIFNGFPAFYSALSITYHIPLTMMLIGIIFRGCAFTFRHYDVVKNKPEKYYSAIFVGASFLTPFALGLIAGGMCLGNFRSLPQTFFGQYVSPWLNWFCISVGILTCALFAFIAAVYLCGEAKEGSLRKVFIRRAKILNVLGIFSGALCFVCAQISGFSLTKLFFAHPISLCSMILSASLLIPLWMGLNRKKILTTRLIGATQVALVIIGWFALQFPVFMTGPGLKTITLYNSAAPTETLRYLLGALSVGTLFILPSLFYLFRIFKK